MRFFSPTTSLRLAVFAISLLVFSGLISADFTWWDDGGTVHHNRYLNDPEYFWKSIGEKAPMQLYIPVTYTVWSGLARIAARPHPDADGIALNPHVFHAANVLLHALAALLAFELVRELVPNSWAAAAGALLFAVHPVQVEPVGWISGLKDVLCGLLSLAALLEYVRFAKNSEKRWHYTAGLCFFVLAMLAKPTAIVVPLMAGCIDWIVLRRKPRDVFVSLVPWLLLMIPCAISTKLSQPAILLTPLPKWMSPAIAGDALAFYLYKLVLPLHLGVDYGRRPTAVLVQGWIYYTWLLPVALGIALILMRRRRPVALAAGILFLLPLLPVLGFTPFMFQETSTTADHYLYLAMIGPALGAAWILDRHATRASAIVVLFVLLALVARTVTLEPVWKNTRTLFEHALEVNPESFVACDMLGFDHAREARILRDEKLTEAASEQFQIAIRYYIHGLTINPRYVPSLLNLAIVFQETGQDHNAQIAIRKFADLQPSLPPELQSDPVDIAQRLISYGDYEGAIGWLNHLLMSHPDNARAKRLRETLIATTRPAGG